MYSWVWYALATLAIGLKLVRVLLTKWGGTVDRTNEIPAKGKIVVITGPTSGIGQACAVEMADRDANVILACRSLEKAKQTVNYIRKHTPRGQLIVMELDLGCFDSVRKFAKAFKSKYDKLDILINNAGFMGNKDKRTYTKDGYEKHLAVNHLGHFLLTNLLIPCLKNAGTSRVVTVSSMAHSWGSLDLNNIFCEKSKPNDKYFISGLYANSKLANALFSKELGRRCTSDGIRSYCLCPGMVFTGLGTDLKVPIFLHVLRPFFWYLLRTPAEGAFTVLYCALSKNVAQHTGRMYRNCGIWNPEDRIELKDEDALKLWAVSEKIVGLSNT